MSKHGTGIEWTHLPNRKGETWNPVRGCRRVSEGCQNCYAETMAARFCGEGQPYEGLAKRTPAGPRWTGEGMVVEHHLDDPLRWTKPRAVFVNSMSDLFFEAFSFETIAAVFGVMAAATDHVFMVLTKRPARMVEFFEWLDEKAEQCKRVFPNDSADWRRHQTMHGAAVSKLGISKDCHHGGPWPLPNVWLGVSVENQDAADERIPLLLQTPAAVRFLSCEPLLGPVELRCVEAPTNSEWACELCAARECSTSIDALSNEAYCWCDRPMLDFGRPSIDWVIAGGESGPGARPSFLGWYESIVEQCQAAGVPVFVKQLGADPVREQTKEEFCQQWDGFFDEDEQRFLTPAEKYDKTYSDKRFPVTSLNLKHSKGGDINEWPKRLRVREFPEVSA